MSDGTSQQLPVGSITGAAGSLPDDMWTPYKHLDKLIAAHLHGQHSETTALETALRTYRQVFVNVLGNAPKNAARRAEILRGIEDGIQLPGLGHTTLSRDLVDETLIISDMYDLNEYVALELLCTAHQQMPNHPGLNRGLVAVLLYYDGRKTQANALRSLFQASEGAAWCSDAPPAVTALVSAYTSGLVADGVLTRCLEQLERLDVTRELALLSENRALGRPKHHRQVLDLFEEVRTQLAAVVFCRAAQQGLSREVTVRLCRYLARYRPAGARGGLDDVTLALVMALMYALDLSALQRYEDCEQLVRRLPIVSEAGFAVGVWEVLGGGGGGAEGGTAGAAALQWECEELRALVLYAFGLAMAGLRQAPQVLQAHAARIIDQDEVLVEAAIQGRVFEFVYHVLLENETVFKVEFYYRRIHILLTDFIELMHSKVTELRARADETARTIQLHQQQGIEPPANLCQDFETLLLIVGRFYANDRLQLQLDLDYWKPMEGPAAGHYSTVSTRSVSLFKFIRLAGDLLPATLFVPYLKMLAGLSNCQASAQRTFDFLKQGSGVSGSATLSWEHFFGSLIKYYRNLRQEQLPTTDTIYARAAGQLGNAAAGGGGSALGARNVINPLEMAGLLAVLRVIRAVARNDEFARIALCDHPNWQPLVVLLGLVGCAVPIPLKAELLRTLAALARSKETALQLWSNLEASQIVQTLPLATGHAQQQQHQHRGGIEADLRQIEARNETYPLTQALLEFLYELCAAARPRNLGAGQRRAGLEPYVRFVCDTVLLRFYNLNYRDAGEKWAVAERCLRLLALWTQQYEVRPGHFPGSGAGSGGADQQQLALEENVPPGFLIMLQLHTNDKSELLRLLLHILDEACTLLDGYVPFAGRASLERAARHALSIVEQTLAQQELFFDAHFAANCSILMSGLSKLLLGVNPRSGRPDHVVNVVRFVTYNVWLPAHALLAVRVLAFVVRQPQVGGLLLGEFTRSAALADELRHGFVECLEADGGAAAAERQANGGDEPLEPTTDRENGTDRDADTVDGIEMATKEAIIALLEECLPQSAPNMAHFLLGFDISRDVRLTRLQQPGVMNFPSNCIKSLLTLLDGHVERLRSDGPAPVSLAQARLTESGYRLLYALCHGPKTADVVLRFLRSCNDFLGRHLAALPAIVRQTNGADGDGDGGAAAPLATSALGQMTGLLRCVAIELKITAQNNQVTQFGHLCQILLRSDAAPTDASAFGYARNATGPQPASGGLLVVQLLNALAFDVQPIDRPKLEFFDAGLIQQLLHSCEVLPQAQQRGRQPAGPRLINIKRLDAVLRGELAVVQSTIAAGQMALILGEKEALLRYALAVNAQKSRYAATHRFMEAWSQCTEIVFSVAPVFALAAATKKALILECLQALLGKVMALDALPELANLASGTVLQLLVTLRQCYAQQAEAQQQLQRPAGGGGDGEAAAHSAGAPKNNALSLKYILKHLVEWILLSSAASQRLKSNLYAALLNFMHIVRGTPAAAAAAALNDANATGSSQYVSRLDRSTQLRSNNNDQETDSGDQNHSAAMAVEVFAGVGDRIVDVLCQDCTGGHDICKMLALACLDMLFDMDPMVAFVQFIERRGYLAHIVDGLRRSDEELCRVLEPQPDNLKALYVYEAKMAMLGRVAGSHIGAALVLEHRALGVLAQMKVFGLHPDFQLSNYGAALQQQLSQPHPPQYIGLRSAAAGPDGAGGVGGGGFVPPVEQRYQQILRPAFNLCDMVLSTLGPENRSAIAQVVFVLLSHGDMVEMVLRAGTPFLGVGLLEELAGITGLIARTASQEYAALSAEEQGAEAATAGRREHRDLGAHLYRLQRLMLALWPRFVLAPATLKELSKTTASAANATGAGDAAGNGERSNGGEAAAARSERIVCCLRIGANLALYARNAIANHAADHRTVRVLFGPGGVAEAAAQQPTASTTTTTTATAAAAGTLDVVPSIGLVVAQLRNTVEYWTKEKHAHDGLLLQRGSLPTLSLDAKNEVQFEQLTEKLTAKQTELRLCVFIVEHCLYLLWAHLDYYTLNVAPAAAPSCFRNATATAFNASVNGLDATTTTMGREGHSAAWMVSGDDMAQLKKVLNQVLNETFSKQLLATAQQQHHHHGGGGEAVANGIAGGGGGVDRDFVAALLRRVKRLIQFAPGAVC